MILKTRSAIIIMTFIISTYPRSWFLNDHTFSRLPTTMSPSQCPRLSSSIWSLVPARWLFHIVTICTIHFLKFIRFKFFFSFFNILWFQRNHLSLQVRLLGAEQPMSAGRFLRNICSADEKIFDLIDAMGAWCMHDIHNDVDDADGIWSDYQEILSGQGNWFARHRAGDRDRRSPGGRWSLPP